MGSYITAQRPVQPALNELPYYKSLEDLMRLPLKRDSLWFTTGAFPPVPEDKAADLPRAPLSRRQDLKTMVDVIVLWAKDDIPPLASTGNDERSRGADCLSWNQRG